MNLSGKTALVTGGAVRIGRAICQALAVEDCRVIIHYHQSKEEAVGLKAEITGQGGTAFVLSQALDSETDCERVMSMAWACTGGVDILVNNAAVFHKDSLSSATEAKLREEMQINFMVPVQLSRLFAQKRKVAGGAGKIVNLLDRRITGHDPSCLPYLISKKMLAEFTLTAALDLAPDITVNAVAPGAVLPPRKTGRAIPEGAGNVFDLAGESPLRHSCSPEDVAQAILFLLRADAVTGQIIFVDGGQHLL